jgi:nucleoid-associated protein YgaU
MFEGWSPQQRKLAMYGAPLVGAVVVGMKLRANSAAAAAAAAAAKPAGNAIPTIAMPSTNVVGVDQLAEYENAVTGVLTHIASAVDNLTKPPTPSTPPPPGGLPITIIRRPIPLPVLQTPSLPVHQTPMVVTPAPAPTPSPPANNRSYTIVSGDTLWGIASRTYGDGGRWTDVYNANAGVIEDAARSHGKASSDNGHWIYPGTTLVLP